MESGYLIRVSLSVPKSKNDRLMHMEIGRNAALAAAVSTTFKRRIKATNIEMAWERG